MTQDRTRAIVEAAERLVDHLNTKDGSFSIGPSLAGDETLRLAAAIQEALSLPAPQWTRTPPSEPGTYWTRRQLDNGRGVLVRIAQVFPDLGMVDFARGDTSVPFAELANDEWFPVRIEEPPA